ncbi:hypothetical protein C8R45DRAFT_941349 [Mycena sanguinolenta]|nr:hypothetical protein C8R45DRAFT_941349 [Mycena sanguinolenta]
MNERWTHEIKKLRSARAARKKRAAAWKRASKTGDAPQRDEGMAANHAVYVVRTTLLGARAVDAQAICGGETSQRAAAADTLRTRSGKQEPAQATYASPFANKAGGLEGIARRGNDGFSEPEEAQGRREAGSQRGNGEADCKAGSGFERIPRGEAMERVEGASRGPGGSGSEWRDEEGGLMGAGVNVTYANKSAHLGGAVDAKFAPSIVAHRRTSGGRDNRTPWWISGFDISSLTANQRRSDISKRRIRLDGLVLRRNPEGEGEAMSTRKNLKSPADSPRRMNVETGFLPSIRTNFNCSGLKPVLQKPKISPFCEIVVTYLADWVRHEENNGKRRKLQMPRKFM